MENFHLSHILCIPVAYFAHWHRTNSARTLIAGVSCHAVCKLCALFEFLINLRGPVTDISNMCSANCANCALHYLTIYPMCRCLCVCVPGESPKTPHSQVVITPLPVLTRPPPPRLPSAQDRAQWKLNNLPVLCFAELILVCIQLRSGGGEISVFR